MLYSWTASHIDTKYKPILLKQMIESLLINKIKNIIISISFDEKYELNEINYMKKHINIMNDNLSNTYEESEIYIEYQNTPLTQFEHLQYIYNNYNFNDDDIILFMDDDDILLELPKDYDKYDGVMGYQYSPIDTCEFDETYTKDINEIINCKDIFEEQWNKVEDFSGYMSRYNFLHHYFIITRNEMYEEANNIGQKYINSLKAMEDIKFMKYLDNFIDYKYDKPFVFHRIWNTDDRHIKTWQRMLE